MMQKIILLGTALLVFIGCAIVLCGLLFWVGSSIALVDATTPVPSTGTIPTIETTSTPPLSKTTLEQLLRHDVPRNDPLELTIRLRQQADTFATPSTPPIYKVGDRATFWVSRDVTGTFEIITATLRYITPHSYMWLEIGENISDGELKSAGDAFENKIYPTDRKYFGSEPTPGIDNDPHIYILNTHFAASVLGYFSSADEYPTFVNRFSNQHEMFYMNTPSIRPGTESYTSVLAHEFAHMIHWNGNRHESSWITEGLGDLAMQLNGFPQDANSFAHDPNLQLNAWAEMGQAIPHYQASYLFLSYCLNRFGEKFLHDLIMSDTYDINSVQRALDKNAPGLKFDDAFADWVVANYINAHALGSRYSYPEATFNIHPQMQYSQYPARGSSNVHQYGTEYIELQPNGNEVTFTFNGATDILAIPTNPHSGKQMWWSQRADQSDTTMTHAFDLSNINRATLNFWTWYDIETDFDYAYVQVSEDSGKTWKALPSSNTTTRDPNSANYGNGLTCKSVSGCREDAPLAQWIQEQMDLTPYAGKKILLRFEYITDAIYSGPGFVIDDISIPEINFFDDAEQGDNEWQAQGFARIDNVLRQRFIIQAIEFGTDGRPLQIVPVALGENNRGTFTTTGFGKNISRAVIAISGSTPITWETTNYNFEIQ